MMKRFLLKIAIFIAGMWILLNGLGYISDKIQPQEEWLYLAKSYYSDFLNRKEDLQAVAMGNSHVNAIDFDALDLEGQHLTRAAADLFEIQKYAENIVKEAPNLKIAFVSVSYFSFNQDNATSNDWRIVRINLYAMLPTWIPIKGDAKNLILGKMQKVFQIMNVARPDNWHSVVDDLLSSLEPNDDNPSDREKADSTIAMMEQCQYLTHEELDTIADNQVKSILALTRKANAHQNLFEDSFRALEKTIETFQSHNIKVILFTPPYYKSYNAYFKDQAPEMITGMHQALNLVQKKYGVSYYNFSDSSELTTSNEIFLDSDHLNRCGRKAFSERLLKAMLESNNNE